MPLFKLTKPVKKFMTMMKKNKDEKRATIREDARKPKNVSKPKVKTTKKPTMKDVAGPNTNSKFRAMVREKKRSSGAKRSLRDKR